MAIPQRITPARRIAVVDDSPEVLRSLGLLLAARGFVVETFIGADELLLEARPGAYDGYVIDLKLDGLDGFGLLEALRGRGITEPAVMISGWELPTLEMTAQRAGFAALVRKPMMDMSLVRVLDELLPAV